MTKEEAYQLVAQGIEQINKMSLAMETLAAQYNIPVGLTRYGLSYEALKPAPDGTEGFQGIHGPGDLNKVPTVKTSESDDDDDWRSSDSMYDY